MKAFNLLKWQCYLHLIFVSTKVCFRLWIQPGDATHVLNISAGVWKPSILLGQKRALKKSYQATACASKDSTLSRAPHLDPRPSRKARVPWEG